MTRSANFTNPSTIEPSPSSAIWAVGQGRKSLSEARSRDCDARGVDNYFLWRWVLFR